jgi:hypothetical protein
MTQTFNQIVVNELQSDLDKIYEHRKAVAAGIKDCVDPVLDDTELTNAFERVIMFYMSKIPYHEMDFSYVNANDMNYYHDLYKITYDSTNPYLSDVILGAVGSEDTVEHTKEYYDTERNK